MRPSSLWWRTNMCGVDVLHKHNISLRKPAGNAPYVSTYVMLKIRQSYLVCQRRGWWFLLRDNDWMDSRGVLISLFIWLSRFCLSVCRCVKFPPFSLCILFLKFSCKPGVRTPFWSPFPIILEMISATAKHKSGVTIISGQQIGLTQGPTSHENLISYLPSANCSLLIWEQGGRALLESKCGREYV